MKQMRLLVAGAALAALAIGYGLLGKAGSAPPPVAQGVVAVSARPEAAPRVPPLAAAPIAIGAAPAQVETQVRLAYPLLRDVAFGCDARGCAITATIPPPTDEAFLEKRQAMLLGGLAHTVEALGYAASGPVQMEEVSENLFHIRLAVAQGRPRG
ncbi:hypothetical protein CA233_00885 [Sphingomonas sp. ABOLD]|uniref:Uncharacterized protein n=1 Tax=Sphingomonas trueperi TaxID=53317 RepID=A0A7X6BCZ6_9SPHN|nr:MULTISPECIES: hypothetical protein [Sphingomonas]NJB97770.1 hypothetical protein [Sphingomonas trueperi]RSV39526.1 hypothetical protein CA234_14845 [Sphingomonas sp. ABOLE]RSV52958.1 hypothetical protein CA233_00885 [Sphingomonas sp. ABOLD]